MSGRWLILADDLTGAADCAIAFARRGLPAAVTWDQSDVCGDASRRGDRDERDDAGFLTPEGLPVLAYDADSRGLPAAAAARRHSGILDRLLGLDRTLFKKIDSTLRGQPAAETRAAIACLRARAGTAFGVCAPAFPATGRTMLDGRIRIDGCPLEETEVWARDHSYPSADVGAVLASADVRAETVPLATVRGSNLAAALIRIAARGDGIAVCDAETDDDLARIVAASPVTGSGTFFIGSAGLAHALAAVGMHPFAGPIEIAPRARGSLIVVGSLAAASRSAARRLAASGEVVHLPVSPETLLDDPAARSVLAARVAAVTEGGGDALVEITVDGDPDMILGPRLVRGLADALETVAPLIGALAVTGGETAAALMARFGVVGIRLIDEIEAGVSLGLTLGRHAIPIATKAGAFGDADTLIRIAGRLRAVRTTGCFS